MAVLKYKNSEGEYVALPIYQAGIVQGDYVSKYTLPTQVETFITNYVENTGSINTSREEVLSVINSVEEGAYKVTDYLENSTISIYTEDLKLYREGSNMIIIGTIHIYYILFNICLFLSYTDSDYTIQDSGSIYQVSPDENNKLTYIIKQGDQYLGLTNQGDGSKFLSDNGEYLSVTSSNTTLPENVETFLAEVVPNLISQNELNYSSDDLKIIYDSIQLGKYLVSTFKNEQLGNITYLGVTKTESSLIFFGLLNLLEYGILTINFYIANYDGRYSINNISTGETVESSNDGIEISKNIAGSTKPLKIVNTGTGNKYLSDSGEYKQIVTVGKIDSNSDGTGEIFNSYGNNKATGRYSHAEGFGTQANGDYSHAEGHCYGGINYYLKASGEGSHAEGYVSTDIGGGIEASGRGSHAEGLNKFGGCHMIAQGDGSHIQNVGTVAKNYGQTSMGCFNEDDEAPKPTSYNASKPALIIGNGTSNKSRGNAFKVLFNGKTYADGEYSSAGADYAEMFEWKDGNLNNEDRVGRFVTLNGKYIEYANESSNYVLGIVSGAPSVIGDDPMRWHGKYLNDEWGRPIYEDVEVKYKEKELQEDGTYIEVEKTRIDHVRKLNPEYNKEQEYVPRIQRPEWDYIGMMGKILVKQDGTLIAGSFCKPSKDGVATKSDTGYYVMEIISDQIARILFK